MGIDYLSILDGLVTFVGAGLYEEDITVGRLEPQPNEYGDAYIKVDYPVKSDEIGKYGSSGYADIDLEVPVRICCNKSDIEDSKERCWEVLAIIEEIFRADHSAGGIEHISSVYLGQAIGESLSGTEHRLSLTVLVKIQYHFNNSG